uniref:PGG domain-containing protein n=1 Tax=Fagus sylvatica TaxID=28930 RepID=A0A2N9GI77_FAGSY
MGALLKFGIRKAGDGKGMARSDSVKEGSETNLLIATLIATVTFTAAFTVPGGYQSQGVVWMRAWQYLAKRASFRAFLIANTLAFGLSITSILVHFFASLGWGGVAFRKECHEVPLFAHTMLL